MVDSAGDKKRSGLNLDKARKVLDLKMHLMYQKARMKAEAAEQRNCERTVAGDLRLLYEQMRSRAREEKQVKERLRKLRHEVDANNEPGEAPPLLTEEDAAYS